MKGLLIKDWLVIWRQCRYILFVPVLFILISGIPVNQGSSAFSAFATLILSMLPVTVLGMDEQSRWDSYALTMPYTRQELVFSKYLLGFISSTAGFLLTFLAGILARPTAESIQQTFTIVLAGFILGMLYISFAMPLFFKFGVQKGRIWFLVLIAALGGGIGLFTSILGETENEYALVASLSKPLYIIAGCTIILFSLSALLSIKIYQKREF